jgi:amino acid transporter
MVHLDRESPRIAGMLFEVEMAEGGTYRRSLGLVELVSLGVGGTIGSGIFVVPGVAAKLSGPGSLIAWVIVALSASCVLFSLASVAYRFTPSSGFYALFESVFGNRIAVPLMILYTISSVFGVSTIAAGIGQYIGYFDLSPVLLIEIVLLAIFCGLNIAGIVFSGMTENILTALKIIPLVLIALLLLPFVRPENFSPSVPLTAGGLLATVIIVYWPFTGFEISAIPVEETRDPSLIRKSLILVMLVVVSLYLVLNIALIGSVGAAALAASPAPIATAAGIIFSRSGTLVAFIGIIAMLSAMNAYIVGTSRVIHSISARFSVPVIKDLSRQGTPAPALLLGCVASGLLLLFSNRFDALATISVITTLVPYIFFCIAAWILVAETKVRVIAAIGIFSTAAIVIIYFIV